jgi:two-component system cell cycle response regulator DivK
MAEDKPTVLIVEDNDRNLKLARELLRIGGFETLEATTGGEAVEMAKRHRPDVIVMDVQLPDFDGWEALRRIRADSDTADQVVVAVTAYAVAGDEPRFLEGGFDGYLTKPIDVRTFSRSIEAFCRRSRSPGG